MGPPENTADGTKTVYFYIKDNNDTEFYTANNVTLETPKLAFSTGATIDNSAAITYVSDSHAPEFNESIQARGGSVSTVTGDYAAVTYSTLFGGINKKYVQLKVPPDTPETSIAGNIHSPFEKAPLLSDVYVTPLIFAVMLSMSFASVAFTLS